MELQEIRTRLEDAIQIRMPRFDPNSGPRDKISGLEDYMNLVAVKRAELEEALFWTWEAKKLIKDQWDGIEGWEPMLGRSERQKPTKEAIASAKRQVNGQVYEAYREVNGLTEMIGRQIRRLELDQDAASRIYTLIVGG